MYFTIYRDAQNQYRWNLKGENHEPVASGESYLQKAGVLHAVALVNGKNDYRVNDQTLGMLDSARLGQLAKNGLGLSATPPLSLSTFAAQPWVNGVGGLLDHATRKK